MPGALKTAMPGIMHKGDVGGVKRAVATADTVSAANDDPASPLGQRVLVVTMIRGEIESPGYDTQPEFGPTGPIGAGGIHPEIVHDVVLARPPLDAAWP